MGENSGSKTRGSLQRLRNPLGVFAAGAPAPAAAWSIRVLGGWMFRSGR